MGLSLTMRGCVSLRVLCHPSAEGPPKLAITNGKKVVLAMIRTHKGEMVQIRRTEWPGYSLSSQSEACLQPNPPIRDVLTVSCAMVFSEDCHAFII